MVTVEDGDREAIAADLADNMLLGQQLSDKAWASVEAYDWLHVGKMRLLPVYELILSGDG